MIHRMILVCLVASFGVVGCGSSDDGGGAAGGSSGAAGAGTGGEGGTSGGSGEGGAGGDPGPEFTSLMDRTDAALAYQLACCQCQGQDQCHGLDAPISVSACLALAPELPFSDRQNDCFDEVIVGEEQMTLENRFDCLIDVDFDAVDCLAAVNECSTDAIAQCLTGRMMGQQTCPTPHEDVVPMLSACQMTVVEDGVDAFLDARSAQCDCITDCTSADPEPEVVNCMTETLQLEVDMLGPAGPNELRCITKFWRQRAVCFGNETTCDGTDTACSDLPLMVCQINGAILDVCL